MLDVTTLDDLARSVVTARAAYAAAEARRKAALAEAEAILAAPSKAAADAKLAAATAEQELRLAALALYDLDGTKAPYPGVGIRVATVHEYDRDAALAWAIEHRMALALDTAAFEAIAKAQPLPFVTPRTVPTATIAKVFLGPDAPSDWPTTLDD